MRVPYCWLAEYCDPGLSASRSSRERLALRTTEVERIAHVGPPSADGFVVGKVLSVERHPERRPAERLRGGRPATATRTIVCGAPNVAAGQIVPVALPGAVMPGGQKLGRAKLRGVTSDGMILSEAELEIGDDADGIVVLDGDAAPGTPLAEVLPVAEPVLELEVNSNRVDCLGVYGVAREVHAFTGAPLAAPPWEGDAEPTGEGEASGLRLGHGRGPGALPALHGPRVHRRDDRPLAAVAEGAADRGRPAADQQRRRHHQLRDAADRPAAARLRPRPGARRRADRPHRGRRREDDHARRGRADLRRRDGAGLRPRRALGDRRDHGRRRSPRSPTRPRACCSRSRPGTASTSCAPRGSSGCAPRPPTGSRSSSIPSSRSAPSGSPRG